MATDQDKPAEDATPTPQTPAGEANPVAPSRKVKLPLVPSLLIVNTALVAFATGLVVAVLPWRPSPAPASGEVEPTHAPASPDEPLSVEDVRAEMHDQAISWNIANGLYSDGEYARALAAFGALLSHDSHQAHGTVAELIRLRRAQCLQKLGRSEEATSALLDLTRASSDIVRAVASITQAQADLQQGRWSTARCRAYASIAAVGALPEQEQLEAHCDFLIADSLGRNALAQWNSPQQIPELKYNEVDPFEGMEDTFLYRFVGEGGKQNIASFTPQIKRLTTNSRMRRYSAWAWQAPLEDVLTRVSAESGLRVQWQSVSPKARSRSVSLRFSDAPEQRLVEVACGMAGLIARFTGEAVIIHDPRATESIEDTRELLYSEAVSSWRRIFLRWPQDARLPEGHLTLAMLYEAAGDYTSALAGYRLTSTRYSSHSASAWGLLHSGKLRMNLKDYAGANRDLYSLLDGYPTWPEIDDAYLQLGLVAFRAGNLDDAIKAFNKLYHLNISQTGTNLAALYLGHCFFQKGDPKEAGTWFEKYLAKPRGTRQHLRDAFSMLAKCQARAGDFTSAVTNMRKALAADPEAENTFDVVMDLGNLLLEINDCVGAMGSLQTLEHTKLTNTQLAKLITLEARVYIKMGLVHKAGAVLRNGTRYVEDRDARIKLQIELARTLKIYGELAQARATLTSILPDISGAVATNVKLELADICLQMGDPKPAASLAQEVFDASTDDEAGRRARAILGWAHVMQKDYPQAAAAWTPASLNEGRQKHE